MNTRMYEREVTFFRQIAPHVAVPMPEVLRGRGRPGVRTRPSSCSRTSGGTAPATRSRAVTPRKPKTSSTPSYRSTSTFWGDTDRDILATAMRIDGEYIEGFSPAPEGTWRRCLEMFDHCMTDYVREGHGALHRRRSASCTASMGARTQTLVHGDVRLDNVMFGEEEGPPQASCSSTGRRSWCPIPLQDLALSREPERPHRGTSGPRGRAAAPLPRPAAGAGRRRTTASSSASTTTTLPCCTCCRIPIVVAGAFDPANDRGRQLAEAFLGRAVRLSPTGTSSLVSRRDTLLPPRVNVI